MNDTLLHTGTFQCFCDRCDASLYAEDTRTAYRLCDACNDKIDSQRDATPVCSHCAKPITPDSSTFYGVCFACIDRMTATPISPELAAQIEASKTAELAAYYARPGYKGD